MSRTFRLHFAIPIIGILGLAFWTYVIAYATGVTSVKLFPKVQEFDWSRPPVRWTSLSMVLISCTPLWLNRLRVILTDDGLTYRGCFRSLALRWSDVTEVRGKAGQEIKLVSAKGCLRLSMFLRNFAELEAQVLARASAASTLHLKRRSRRR